MIIWDVAAGKRQLVLQVSESAGVGISLAWSPDGSEIVTSSDDGEMVVWSTETGHRNRAVQIETSPEASVTPRLAWSSDGRLIASAIHDRVDIWDAETGRRLSFHRPGLTEIIDIAWSPRALRLAMRDQSGIIATFDAETGKASRRLETLMGEARSNLSWSEDGKQIAIGLAKGIGVWNIEGGELTTSTEKIDLVDSVTWASNHSIYASAQAGCQVIEWDINTDQFHPMLTGFTNRVTSMVWSTQLTFSTETAVLQWDIAQNRPSHLLTLEGDQYAVALSPNGKLLTAWDNMSHTAHLIDAVSGEALRAFENIPQSSPPLVWSTSGNQIASPYATWDVATGNLSQALFDSRGAESNAVAWSGNDQTLATGSPDGQVILWNPGDGKSTDTLNGAQGWISSVAWSPNGELLAAGTWSNELAMWRVSDRRRIWGATLEDKVLSLAWRPDGKALAVGLYNGVVVVWDIESNKALHRLPGHNGAVLELAWSPQAEFLASGSSDGTVIIWKTSTPTEIQLPFNDKNVEHEYCQYPSVKLSAPDAQGLNDDEIAEKLMDLHLAYFYAPQAPDYCRIEGYEIDKIYYDERTPYLPLEPKGDFMRVVQYSIKLIQIPNMWMSLAGAEALSWYASEKLPLRYPG